MSNVSHFQNHEMIIAFDKVSHVTKFPPDRLEVVTVAGGNFMILGDDCKDFLQNYLTYLNVQAKQLVAQSQPQTQPAPTA